MTDSLFCCPVCSVLPAPGLHLSPEQMRGWMAQPVLWHGRRSGKFWIQRRFGCAHGPVRVEGADQADGIIAAWNAWARTEAEAKAERLAFTDERKARWLYELGMAGLPEIIFNP